MDQAVINAMRKNFEEAKKNAKSNDFPEISDGTYVARLKSAKSGVSQKGRPQLIMCWVILEGEYAGDQTWDFPGLDGESLQWTLKKLSTMGVDLDTLLPEDIDEVCENLVADRLTAKIKLATNKGGYQNLSVVKLLDNDDFEVAPSAEDVDEDALPVAESPTEAEDPAEDSAATEAEEEEVAPEESDEGADDGLRVGMLVDFVYKGEQKRGVLREIVDEDYVKVGAEGKRYTVSADMVVVAPGGGELEE